MAENETSVLYKAFADFTNLHRAANRAKRSIRELREEEAKLNAQSVSGAAAQTIATQKAAKSQEAVGKAYDASGQAARRAKVAFKETADEAQRTADATDRTADATERAADAQNTLAGATRRSFRETLAGRQATEKAAEAVNKLEGVTRKQYRAMQEQARHNSMGARAMRGLTEQATRLNSAFQRLGNWRPKLTPPFIALIPIIAGVIGLINPLVAGLGAVGTAAFGFAVSLSSVAGAALGAIPALASLLSVVFALKTAFGGIGGAFKAFTQMKEAASAGGAGTPEAAELTRAEELTRAQDKYARSIQNVAWAQEDLDDARKDYVKRLAELQKAVDKAAMSEARAAANSRLAQENYANVLADPGSSKGQKMDAKVGVDEAGAEFNDVLEENKQNVADLAEMKQKGMEGDRSVIQAQRNLTDAINAQRDAQLDLINTQKGANQTLSAQEQAVNAYEQALSKLSPSARKFVETIVGMREEWTALQKRVQERFFSKFVDDVGRLRLLFGPLEVLLGGAADALGRFVDNFLLLVTSPAWQEDITIFGEKNIGFLDNIGDGLIDVLDAFRNIAIVAQEVLLLPMGETFRDWAESFRQWVETGRTSGGLQEYLEGVRTRLAQWWRIVKNIGMTLFNYGSAAGDFADWITTGFEKITEGWRKNSEDALKEGSPFQQYLEDIKPLLSEVRGLFGDFFGWLSEEAMDKENIQAFTDIVKAIREDLGPAIADFLDKMSESGVGEAFVDAIAKVIEIITILASSGAVETFFGILGTLLDFLKTIMSIPGVDAVLGAIAAGFAAIAAVAFVGKFSGITSLVNLLLKLARGGKGLPGLLKGIGGALAGALGIIIPTGGGGKGGKGGGAAGKAAGGAVKGGGRGLAGLIASAIAFLPGLLRGPGPVGTVPGDVSGGKAAGKGMDVFGTFGKAVTPAAAKGAGNGFNLLGSIAKGAAKGVGLGAALSIIGTVAGDLISSGAAEGGAGAGQRAGGGVLAGAATGAGIGAIAGNLIPIPGVGAGIGAAVGGVIGGAAGFAGMSDEDKAAFFEDLGKNWNDFWGTKWPEFWTGLAANIGTFFENVGIGWNQYWGTEFPNFWIGLVASIGTFFEGIGTAWDTYWGTTFPKFWSDFGLGLQNFFLVEFPTFVGEALANFWILFTDGIPGFFTSLGENWNTYWGETFPKFWSDWWAGIESWWAEWSAGWDTYWGEEFPKFWSDWWEGIPGFFTEWGENWNGYWGTEFPKFWTDWGAGVAGWFEGFGADWNNYWGTEFPQFWIDWGAGIAGFFTDFGKAWDDYWGDEWPAFWDGLATGWNDFWGGIGGLLGDIGKTIGKAFAGRVADHEKEKGSGDVPRGAGSGGQTLSRIQKLLPGGMRISSTYRSPEENRRAGGSSTSYHMDEKNPAVDIVGSASQMASFATILGKVGGWRQLYYNGVQAPGVGFWPGHWDHIHVANTGGQVPGRGNGDTVPSMLTPGEFVVKKSIVGRVGADNLARFNSGVMSFSDLLRQGMGQPGKKKMDGGGLGGGLPMMFNGGGLVPGLPFGDVPPQAPGNPGGGEGFGGGGMSFGDIHIHNPVPETSSESLPRTIRKVAYLGARR